MAKTVQELSMDKLIPERYIYKHRSEAIYSPSIDIPVLDVSLLSSSEAGDDQLDKLSSALRSWGCFQAINHGIESSLIDKMHEVSKQFFALSMGEKREYSRAADSIEGYGNDMVLSETQTLDWTDRLYLKVFPEDDQNLKLWPQNPQPFRETSEEYMNKLSEITRVVLKAMARSLNINDDTFLRQCGVRQQIYARYNFYPPCPRPDQVLGVKQHADGSVITILLQDTRVEGLQIFKDDKWIQVPIIPYALVVNLGDLAEVMSNGVFKSPLHRAVVNSERERITVAVFFIPERDKEIEPAECLIGEQNPRSYKKVKNYEDNYFQYYQQGKRTIEAVKI